MLLPNTIGKYYTRKKLQNNLTEMHMSSTKLGSLMFSVSILLNTLKK